MEDPGWRRARCAILPLLSSILVFSLSGCDRGDGDAPGRDGGGAARSLTMIVSADTAGWITPCGCASNQSGGMPRRGSYVAAARGRGDVLYADAGGAAGGTSNYHRVKFEAILASEKKM